MWQFEQAVQGIGDACLYFDIPVVSGNVSLYNETKGEAIFPTPIVAVVGLIEDQTKVMTQGFKKPGHCIGLIGFTIEELGGSEYMKVLLDKTEGKPPVLNRKNEKHENNKKLCTYRPFDVSGHEIRGAPHGRRESFS